MRISLVNLVCSFFLSFVSLAGASAQIHDTRTSTILLLGDNNVQNRENPGDAFRFLLPYFKRSQFIFLNLEGPFAKGWNNSESRDIPHKNWSHSAANQVAALTAAGVTGVGVSNNVTYPWQAFVKSKHVLDSAGILFTGGGMNEHEARKPIIVEKNGLKVGFIQYAATVYPTNHVATESQPGILGLKVHTAYEPPPQVDKPGQPPIVHTWLDAQSKDRLIEDIAKLRKSVDYVVASCHWGVSDTYEVIDYQLEIANTMISAGADIVMGHGPHRLQKVALIDNKPVFFSLGQGVFDDPWNERSAKYKEGIMIKIETSQNRENDVVSIIPLWREDDNELRAYDPRIGQGKYVFEYLKRVTGDTSLFQVKNNEILLNIPKKQR